LEPQPNQRLVTLVDDEPVALDVLVRAARAFHFDCQTAASAEQAITVLESRPTPLVVTDLRMPGQGGLWLVREIRRRWPEIAVLVVTAGVEDEALAHCLKAGVKHYFLKPVRIDEFHHALHATWEDRLLHQERQRYQRMLERVVSRQTQQLKSTFFSAIDSLVRTLEARDPYTSGHSLRVRAYAMRLGRRVGLDVRAKKALSLAAKLHDIGKVGVPECILNKPAELTPAELCLVREHPVVGERILSPIIRSRTVLAAIRGHHERYDGRGYPDGLAGDDIPLLARLISVADCFDAMTSVRAYRAPLSIDDALDALVQGAGTQFDPSLIPYFIQMVRTDPVGTFG
jgi:putative two-component system response regulator